MRCFDGWDHQQTTDSIQGAGKKRREEKERAEEQGRGGRLNLLKVHDTVEQSDFVGRRGEYDTMKYGLEWLGQKGWVYRKRCPKKNVGLLHECSSLTSCTDC